MLIRNEFARAGFCKSVLVGEKDLNNCTKQYICLSKVSYLCQTFIIGGEFGYYFQSITDKMQF